MKKRLSERQRRFVDNYIADPNATKAALDAGYSPEGVNVTAHNLMQKPYIRKAIEERLEEIRSERIAMAEEILEYLTAVMRGETLSEVLCLCGDGCQKVIDIHPSTNDRLKAAELLGKRYGLFNNKVAIEVPVVIMGEADLVD